MKKRNLWYLVPVLTFLSSLWVSHGAKDFYDRVLASVLNYPIPLIIVAHLAGFAVIFYINTSKEHQTQLKDRVAMFLNVYDKLAAFKKIEILRKVMDNL